MLLTKGSIARNLFPLSQRLLSIFPVVVATPLVSQVSKSAMWSWISVVVVG